jgi:hypothetical protein
MEIDPDTGEILEDGSEEEFAEWLQRYKATRDSTMPCESQDDPCPF